MIIGSNRHAKIMKGLSYHPSEIVYPTVVSASVTFQRALRYITYYIPVCENSLISWSNQGWSFQVWERCSIHSKPTYLTEKPLKRPFSIEDVELPLT